METIGEIEKRVREILESACNKQNVPDISDADFYYFDGIGDCAAEVLRVILSIKKGGCDD